MAQTYDRFQIENGHLLSQLIVDVSLTRIFKALNRTVETIRWLTNQRRRRARPHPPQDLHWGISYLREDIQDIRQETRQEFQNVRQEFQNVRGEFQNVRGEFQNVRQEIHDLRQDMQQEFRQSRKSVDSRFFMLLGSMVTMTGIVLAAVKL